MPPLGTAMTIVVPAAIPLPPRNPLGDLPGTARRSGG
jgi:hypothetical protein